MPGISYSEIAQKIFFSTLFLNSCYKKHEISVNFEIIINFFRYYDKVRRLKERQHYTRPSASKPGLRTEPALDIL